MTSEHDILVFLASVTLRRLTLRRIVQECIRETRMLLTKFTVMIKSAANIPVKGTELQEMQSKLRLSKWTFLITMR